MPRSSSFTRAVVLVGALTTIATSSVSDPILTTTESRQLTAHTPVHVTVTADRAVMGEAESLLITARVHGSGVGDVRFVPDDPALPARTVAATDLTATVSWVYLADSAVDPEQGQFACSRDAACELGFTVEVLAEGPDRWRFDVDASATSEADQSLCFPDDATFAETAALEIRIDGAP